MELLLVIIAATLMSGFLFGAFYLGTKYENPKKAENVVNVDDTNIETISKLMEWMSYGGKK